MRSLKKATARWSGIFCEMRCTKGTEETAAKAMGPVAGNAKGSRARWMRKSRFVRRTGDRVGTSLVSVG